jgi:hypothetical protein
MTVLLRCSLLENGRTKRYYLSILYLEVQVMPVFCSPESAVVWLSGGAALYNQSLLPRLLNITMCYWRNASHCPLIYPVFFLFSFYSAID